MRKICIVTGTRAEYGLLYWLIKKVHEDVELELQLIVTGMHLSPEFGLTWKEIELAGFPISRKIEMVLSSDTSVGISKSMGLAQISFGEAFEQLKPDILVLLGDRTEILSAAIAALVSGIPIAHIHGGEITEGAYDDSIRHAITKMSHLHFTSTEEYKKRVIQMGEAPETVFNFGAPGIESIKYLKLLSKTEFEQFIGRKLKTRNLLITFHPATAVLESVEEQLNELLQALNELPETLLIFTKPNSDKGGRIIIRLIDDFVKASSDKAISFKSMGQVNYLSAIPLMDAVVGNSSSGIIEVPVFNTPTVNIGTRQKGRVQGPLIFNCVAKKSEILKTLKQAYQYDRSSFWKHPYGDGNTASEIVNVLKKIKSLNPSKKFYDR
jgi:GDP/UDP-N,N'-diacetylbacillosamine 2-epimerase (hydrolysing)